MKILAWLNSARKTLPACEEHMVIGTAFGNLMCFDCGREVVLSRGIWASNWYAEDKDKYLERMKKE